MSDTLLDFAADDERAGFRLHRFELLNWGTFNRKVWTLFPKGDNALLTGDIGSGKSTMVDAITTLIVPPQRLSYNKAAGAEARERTLRSYVLGHYKSERSDMGLSAKAVALRDHNSYSVVLGVFRNEGYGLEVTLAQVFWIKDTQGQPARFYLVADRDLSIGADFAGFGSDINDLRKRVRASDGVELFESFPPYAAAFRRRFGIENEQALELFNQTVSMKVVGNLTDFVRDHMLEAFDMESRVDALIHHFDDLNRAHEAVLKAKDQVALLKPLVEDSNRYVALLGGIEDLKACREALRPWFAGIKAGLLERRLADLGREAERLANRVKSLGDERNRLRGERDELNRAIAENGGERIERLKAEISNQERERTRRRERADRYRALLASLELDYPGDVDTFSETRSRLERKGEAFRQRESLLQNSKTEQEFEFRTLREDHTKIAVELESLRMRRSNIPQSQVAIRSDLCAALDLREESMPFTGELIQVRPGDSAWEGSAERLLHNFGLSLLVPERHYAAVSEWVDRTHLRGRLVYFRVRDSVETFRGRLHEESLVRKLEIKNDSPFYDWLEAELSRRFDYACTASMDDFRRERQALTPSGQIKGGGERHEKDDRSRVDDRSRFILGWTNEAKIKTLERQALDLESRIQAAGTTLSKVHEEIGDLQDGLRNLAVAGELKDYAEIDWQSLARSISVMESEILSLQTANDTLKALARRLAETEKNLSEIESRLDSSKAEAARNEERQEQARAVLESCREIMSAADTPRHESLSARLEDMRAQAVGATEPTVESCDKHERDTRDLIQSRMDAEEKKRERLHGRITEAMGTYCARYPLETREIDVSVEAAPEYGSMLSRLEADDLPRFEQQFKSLLNENTIREVANFQSQLARERQSIKERIELINKSLVQIDYNPGRFIFLEAQPSPDPEIRDFQQELRACTEGSLTGSGDEQYSEAKFLQVKRIIERFRGREGLSELDRRWTRKVTDVRHAFVFSASERWHEDQSEYEHYTDSGGKSGGQKEKLAYTVLAASLAYQFGLEWGSQRSRSFRFVMIDEAFGRGSDESAAYGLELFKKLKLQLLVITPLQKIHIIEPYVASVGFVYNEDGQESKLRNLSIEEYRAEREERKR